jgi:hypothetical protein
MMFGDMQHIIADTWRQLKAQVLPCSLANALNLSNGVGDHDKMCRNVLLCALQERAPYEAAAQHDFHRYLNEKGLFDELQAKYMLLRRHTEESGISSRKA